MSGDASTISWGLNLGLVVSAEKFSCLELVRKTFTLGYLPVTELSAGLALAKSQTCVMLVPSCAGHGTISKQVAAGGSLLQTMATAL